MHIFIILHLGIFLFHPLHCLENLSMCFRFSFMIALTVINKVNDFRVPQDS